MTVTTIKVDSQLRDRLKAAAAEQGHTIGAHIELLLDDEARRHRFEAVRRARAATPPDEDYLREAEEWQRDFAS